MFDYSAFGGHLRSELEIPDLTPAVCTEPTWTLRVGTHSPPEVKLVLRGTSEPVPGLVLRLFDTSLGMRLEGNRIGVWDLTNNGRTITCWMNTQEQRAWFRGVLLGPVVPLVLDTSGVLCLHGSAVAFDGACVVFLAPKLHGKSTLALALTLAGAQLVTDDLVAIDVYSPPLVRPGAQGLRLFSDSLEQLSVGHLLQMPREEIKHTLTTLPSHMLERDPVRLAGIYILEPVDARVTDRNLQRCVLHGADAVIAIAQRAKLSDALIGYSAAGARLEPISQLVNQVPVYRLQLAHGWEHFEDCVMQVCAWHGNCGGKRGEPAFARAVTVSPR